jgi:hypothetical protein
MPLVVVSVRWTNHALDKAAIFNVPRLDAETIVVEHHHARRRNERGADWRVANDWLVIAYNHPDLVDSASALIVTLWRRR